MKFKALMNLLPVGAIAIVGITAWQSWQRSYAQRVDYDNPTVAQHSGLSPAPGQSEHWTVVRVSDGDTITVRQGRREERIRFCGIDAPESAQRMGAESTAYLQSMIDQAGGSVILFPVERDRYGRQVAEVFIAANNPANPEEERLLNYEMVAAGMAYVYPQYISGCPNGGAIAQGESIARQQQLGVWRDPNAVKPWDYRRQQRR